MMGVLGQIKLIHPPKRSKMDLVSTADTGSVYLDFNDEKVLSDGTRSSFLPQSLLTEDQPPRDKGGASIVTFCGATHVLTHEVNKIKRITKFVTGTKYLGEWNRLGFTGKGVYRFPHGVIYDGHFNRNNQFHGTGLLIYPNGQRLEGIWKNGKLSPGASFVTRQNNQFNDNYCRMPDRRYQIEIQSDLQPANQEYLTNDPEPKEIPPGCYDVGDGFYDPELLVKRTYNNTDDVTVETSFDLWMDEERRKDFNYIVSETPSEREFLKLLKRMKANSTYALTSIPLAAKQDWIKKNCRHAWTESTGYRPDLYEDWTSGAKKYILQSSVDDNRNTVLSSISCSIAPAVSMSDTFSQLEVHFGSTRQSSVLSCASLQALSTMFINPIGIAQSLRKFKVRRFQSLNVPKRKRASRKQSKGQKRSVNRVVNI